MTAMVAEGAIGLAEDAAKSRRAKWFEIALTMHLAAGRFGSPAGLAFLPQSYMPLLKAKPDAQ